MTKWWLLAAMLAFIVLSRGLPAVAAAEDEAVRGLLMATFDKPEARLNVDPVIIVHDHAIADWTQGRFGGRALLRRVAGAWSIVLCSGDGIVSSDALRRAGVPGADADGLAAALDRAERSMLPDRRRLLGTFEGTVMMEAGGQHPPLVHGHDDEHSRGNH